MISSIDTDDARIAADQARQRLRSAEVNYADLSAQDDTDPAVLEAAYAELEAAQQDSRLATQAFVGLDSAFRLG